MRKAMKHNEPNGNAGELMLELRSPHFVEGFKTIPTNTKTLSGGADLFL